MTEEHAKSRLKANHVKKAMSGLRNPSPYATVVAASTPAYGYTTSNSGYATTAVGTYQAQIDFEPRAVTAAQISEAREALKERLVNMLADLFDGMGISDETLGLLAERLGTEAMDTFRDVLRDHEMELGYRHAPKPHKAVSVGKVGGRATYDGLEIRNMGTNGTILANTFIITDGTYAHSTQVSMALLDSMDEETFVKLLVSDFKKQVKQGTAMQV